ncbi:MAG: non-homologous end-joining DNA ligase [Thermocrispum sp.]
MNTEEKVRVQVQDRQLVVSNLSKVLYPSHGFTKAQVIEYYLRIAPVLLPHIKNRPLTLKRYPDGVESPFFYQKNVPLGTPDWVPTATVPAPGSTMDREQVEYVVAGDLPTLIWAANLANLEIHTPQWRLPLDEGRTPDPDLLVFDLDPGPPATIVECCEVAQLLRPVLQEHGFEPFAKTSGNKGMQLLAAIDGHSSAAASGLAKQIAEELAATHPRRVTAKMTKSLRARKVFIDWSQNNAFKTTVAPYSLRARNSPTVSTPVSWDEVADCTEPLQLQFTSREVLDRLEERGDLLAQLVGEQD